MAAFWLLATQHCNLEAAQVLEEHAAAEQGCCAGGEAHCVHDGCRSVEDLGYRDMSIAKVPPPVLTLCACLISVHDAWLASATQLAYLDIAFERPREWVPVWQFVRRAALSPRAPAIV